MSWQKEVEELEKRKRLAHQMGGEGNVAHQHDLGKMTVRERIAALVDTGSFLERGAGNYFRDFLRKPSSQESL
jgi:acetyl-CoA carboxylase carboxyltransferase component